MSTKKKNKTCFLTTVFEVDDEIKTQYFQSLDKQTAKNFDLVLLDDGCKNLKHFVDGCENLDVVILDSDSISHVHNRYSLINYAINNDYKFIIFGDFDDWFDENRVEAIQRVFSDRQDCDIVVNELILFDTNGVISENIIQSRLGETREIVFQNILKKNFMGLSNSAIKLKSNKLLSYFNEELDVVALDWYLFSRALLDGAIAVFTDSTNTHYRQHGDNVAHITNTDDCGIRNTIRVKIQHYTAMEPYSTVYNELLCYYQELEEPFPLKVARGKAPLLWWENI